MNWLSRTGRLVGNHLPAFRGSTAIINRCIRPLYRMLYPGPVAAPLFGYTVELDPSEAVEGRMLFYPARYDAMEIAFLRTWLRPGDTFVDGGANAGFYSFAALSMGVGKVVAVEAEPGLADRLRTAFVANGVYNVEVINVAISDSEGELALYLNEGGNAGGHTINAHWVEEWGVRRRKINVPSKPLSTILRPLGRVRAMKLDIEGAEYRALSEMFASGIEPPDALILEHVGASTDPDHIELCQSNGYRLVPSKGENFILTR